MTAKYDATRIKKLREWLAMSTDELAVLLGVGEATVYRWCAGSLKPSVRCEKMLMVMEFLMEFPDQTKAVRRRRSIAALVRLNQPLRATWKLLDFYYRNASFAEAA